MESTPEKPLSLRQISDWLTIVLGFYGFNPKLKEATYIFACEASADPENLLIKIVGFIKTLLLIQVNPHLLIAL